MPGPADSWPTRARSRGRAVSDDVLSIEELVFGTHYTRTCRICGVRWLQTLYSEASKDICSVACQDEADRQHQERMRDHVHDGPYCSTPTRRSNHGKGKRPAVRQDGCTSETG